MKYFVLLDWMAVLFLFIGRDYGNVEGNGDEDFVYFFSGRLSEGLIGGLR